MKIKESEKLILHILQNCLFNSADNKFVLPDDTDWQEIFEEANSQAIAPIIYQGLFDGQYKIPDDIRRRWKKIVINQVHFNEQLLFKQDEIIRLLKKADISYAILKGAGVSAFYPKPELRISGDIDLLFEPSECMRVVDLLCENGFSSEKTNTQVHEVAKKNNIRIEPHYMVAEMPDTDTGRKMKLFFDDALDHTETAFINNYTFSVLSAKHQAAALLLHMARHISHEGIGLKQLCDWAVFIHKRTDHLFWTGEIQPVLSEFGLLQAAKIITKTCAEYLGLPRDQCGWCMDIDSRICGQLMDFVLQSGHMGRKNLGVSEANLILTGKDKSNSDHSFTGSIRSNMSFIIKRDFPVCKKIPVLVPVLWLFLPVKYAFRGVVSKNRNESVFKVLAQARKHKKLFEQMGIR